MNARDEIRDYLEKNQGVASMIELKQKLSEVGYAAQDIEAVARELNLRETRAAENKTDGWQISLIAVVVLDLISKLVIAGTTLTGELSADPLILALVAFIAVVVALQVYALILIIKQNTLGHQLILAFSIYSLLTMNVTSIVFGLVQAAVIVFLIFASIKAKLNIEPELEWYQYLSKKGEKKIL